MQEAPIVIREAAESDLSFILDSWLRSYRTLDPWARAMHATVFFKGHKEVVSAILTHSKVIVACNKDDPDQIYGYGVYQPTSGGLTICHYLYVKSPYRRLGIGHKIFREALKDAKHNDAKPVLSSHAGKFFENFLRRKWNLVFNPYVLGEEFLQ